MKICAYVMDSYAKQTYAVESHDVRAWPGFEVALDSVRRAGYLVEYAGRSTVHEYDVVLVSITSDCDFWPFIAERVKWKGAPFVICGGAGVLNIRPFLQFFSAFVLGRGENILPKLLKAYETGNVFESSSVVYSESFDVCGKYEIAQANVPYPHQVIMTNGKPFLEGSIGCPNKCFFCGYTWHRKYIGDGTFAAGAQSMSTGNRERTIIDLLKLDYTHWQDEGPVRIVGVDGTSERLRFQANKRISREMLKEFLGGLAKIDNAHQVKLYFICGYPNESEADWMEFVEDLRSVDSSLSPGKQWSLLCHFTPFRAMPATPSAPWPMSYQNYRGRIAAALKQPQMKGNIFYQGNKFWCVEGMGTDSLSSVVHSAMVWRGIESDGEIIAKISTNGKYWKANCQVRQATLEKYVDVGRLFRGYSWDDLPTRYLHGYVKQELVQKAGNIDKA